MRMRAFAATLLVSLITSACALGPKHSWRDLEVPATFNSKPETVLTAGEVRRDLELLNYALNTAYSGRKLLPVGQFETLTTELSRIVGPLTAKDLCLRIAQRMSFASDAHLKARFNGENCLLTTVDELGGVGRNFHQGKSKPWDVRIDKRKSGTALLVAITGFPSHTSPVWAGFLERVSADLPKADLLILDLRGNGGGDDTTGKQLSDLLAGVNLKTPYGPQWRSETPESYQILANAMELWIREESKGGSPAPEYLMKLKADFLSKRDSAKTEAERYIAIPPANEFDPQRGFKKPFYILMDAGCASSCESTIDFFEFNPHVRTVGESTAGYIHFGNNGQLILPRSGIRIQMATTYNTYLDGRFLEKKGIDPRITVTRGEDALETAWSDFQDNVKSLYGKQ